MIVKQMLNPESIVVVGASNDVQKIGGKVLKNILENCYNGKVYGVNPKENIVQGMECYADVSQLPDVDLAIIAIAAKFTEEAVRILANEKKTKAFIILSAGFSEVGPEGRILEERLAKIIDDAGGTLIGPNCIGVLTTSYKGVFAGPIPKFDPKGCDCVSASGATMVFIVEMAMQLGITFSSIFSVGNSAQVGVEDVLEYWDESFDPKTSSKLKLIYIEQILNPQKLLKHARSLVSKGCSIAGIKAGTTEAGARAVSSHTGALAGSDTATEALFRKAGIVRCGSREELVYVIGAMTNKPLKGDRIAVITHAGGPGVMLTDALSKGGMKVPNLSGASADKLLEQLYHGSSVANPIDFLATGTAEQLGLILDTIENEFDNIDASVVIFGTTGMFDVTTVYDTINEKMKSCRKPIYPVMPSVIQASTEMSHFKELGQIAFTDEVALGNALCKINSTSKPFITEDSVQINENVIRNIIDNAKDGSYLKPEDVQNLIDLAGILRVPESVVSTKEDAVKASVTMGFPVVMKVVGPVHKSDVGGVKLSVQNASEVGQHYDELMKIDNADGVLIQKMISGQEIFIGAKREDKFGHLILCGLGGIFIEVLKDVSYGLAPIGRDEAMSMIKGIKAYGLIEGVRGREGVNVDMFADAIVNLSLLLKVAPEIAEMDINPLLGTMRAVTAVDARILIKK